MILIDYQGGGYGFFLEAFLNGTLTGELDMSVLDMPNLTDGPEYKKWPKFLAEHMAFHPYRVTRPYSEQYPGEYERFIVVKIENKDLPKFLANTFQAPGVTQHYLLNNFYNCLDNPYRRPVRDTLINWEENKGMSSSNPAVDKNSFREHIKRIYYNKDLIVAEEDQRNFEVKLPVFYFPYSSLNDWQYFKPAVEDILSWAKLSGNVDLMKPLYDKFIMDDPFRNLTATPEDIIQALKENKSQIIPYLNIYQEAYLDYLIEIEFNKPAFYSHTDGKYWKTTQDILKYINANLNE